MEEKNDRGRTAAMDEALEAGYRASRSLGTAIRRADDTTSIPVRNGLGQAEESLEAARFALERSAGWKGLSDGARETAASSWPATGRPFRNAASTSARRGPSGTAWKRRRPRSKA